MKILAIVGSRRKNGNTAALVQKALEPFVQDTLDSGFFVVVFCWNCYN